MDLYRLCGPPCAASPMSLLQPGSLWKDLAACLASETPTWRMRNSCQSSIRYREQACNLSKPTLAVLAGMECFGRNKNTNM